MTADFLIEKFEKIELDPEISFYLDNSPELYDPDKKFFITKIRLDFQQLWCMFGEIPIIHKRGKCKYEWVIHQTNSNRIFSIYDWNNKNDLMHTTQWYIRSNMPGDSSLFLKTLSEAIECYNTFYKHKIHTLYESSLNENTNENEKLVNEVLSDIKQNFMQNIDLLQTL